MGNESTLVALGTLGKPYKLYGEIYFIPFNHNSNISFKGMNVLFGIDENKTNNLFVESFNSKSNILKFKNIDSKESASKLSKKKIFILRHQMPKLNKGEYYLVDLIGCTVLSDKNEKIGNVDDITSLPANDVIIVKNDNKEYLIPLIDDIIKFIDIKNKKIEIIVMPGLL